MRRLLIEAAQTAAGLTVYAILCLVGLAYVAAMIAGAFFLFTSLR